MSGEFQYTTPEQQIQKLKSQHLSFCNEADAKQVLEIFGYYNIINGYRDPYIIRDYAGKKYNADATFEQIFALFILDHTIRDAVLLSMIDLEEHLRAVTADIIAESFGSDHHQYLSKNNYRDKYVRDSRFSRNHILSGMIRTAENSHTQPIKYYRETHNIIPPWILLKGCNFGTLVNFIRFFKSPQRDMLIKTLYGNKITDENLSTYKDLLSDTLFVCLEYRNLAAHGGRIYNHIPNSNIRQLENSEMKKGLPQLIQILSEFRYLKPFQGLDEALSTALNNYCQAYPNDLERLKRATGFEIYVEQQVWINNNTHKYHVDKHCSGSKCHMRINLEHAKNKGFIPCKKCFKNL